MEFWMIFFCWQSTALLSDVLPFSSYLFKFLHIDIIPRAIVDYLYNLIKQLKAQHDESVSKIAKIICWIEKLFVFFWQMMNEKVSVNAKYELTKQKVFYLSVFGKH